MLGSASRAQSRETQVPAPTFTGNQVAKFAGGFSRRAIANALVGATSLPFVTPAEHAVSAHANRLEGISMTAHGCFGGANGLW